MPDYCFSASWLRLFSVEIIERFNPYICVSALSLCVCVCVIDEASHSEQMLFGRAAVAPLAAWHRVPGQVLSEG